MNCVAALDSNSDPFGERAVCPLHTRAQVLGARFEFESNDASLLHLVDSVYAGLPAHTFGAEPPHLRIRLLLSEDAATPTDEEPPLVRMHSGNGVLCGIMDGANFSIVAAAQRSALVVVSRSALRRHPHTVRYELIEFAVYTLASRVQQLVSLHAACIGCNQQGLLLIGDGGVGKTTLTLHCLLRGLELVAEDAVFVQPDTLLASGIGSFLHLREDSLEFLQRSGDDVWIRESPVIRRRSGVEKFAVDLRRSGYRIAGAPLKIAGVIFLSVERASERGLTSLLMPLRHSELLERLAASQPYAAHQPGWTAFLQNISGTRVFELRRGEHPGEAADALRRMMECSTSSGFRQP